MEVLLVLWCVRSGLGKVSKRQSETRCWSLQMEEKFSKGHWDLDENSASDAEFFGAFSTTFECCMFLHKTTSLQSYTAERSLLQNETGYHDTILFLLLPGCQFGIPLQLWSWCTGVAWFKMNYKLAPVSLNPNEWTSFTLENNSTQKLPCVIVNLLRLGWHSLEVLTR